MNRSQFNCTGAAGLSAAARGSPGKLLRQAGNTKPPRVGLIGPGWYGKADLFRLIQLVPASCLSAIWICASSPTPRT